MVANDDEPEGHNFINEAIEGMLDLERRAARLAAMLHVQKEERPASAEPWEPNALEVARRLIRLRRRRDDMFAASPFGSGAFGEPIWDMLLDLFVARSAGRPISVSSLAIAAAVPATTALRHINAMVSKGMVIRRNDPDDSRRVIIELSDGAAEMIQTLLSG